MNGGMTGWKTKLGGVLIAVGEALKQSLPTELTWVGMMVQAIGMAFSVWGIGHKIDKLADQAGNKDKG